MFSTLQAVFVGNRINERYESNHKRMTEYEYGGQKDEAEGMAVLRCNRLMMKKGENEKVETKGG